LIGNQELLKISGNYWFYWGFI